MKHILIAALALVLLMALTVPALAAGNGHGQERAAVAREQASEADDDELEDAEEPDGDEESEEETRPAEFPADPDSAAWAHNRSIWSDRHPHASRETTGKPEWAGTNVPTANAQGVLARNAEKLELHLNMRGEIREKLADLYADIIEKLQAAQDAPEEELPE